LKKMFSLCFRRKYVGSVTAMKRAASNTKSQALQGNENPPKDGSSKRSRPTSGRTSSPHARSGTAKAAGVKAATKGIAAAAAAAAEPTAAGALPRYNH
jgi:hypothetical protein